MFIFARMDRIKNISSSLPTRKKDVYKRLLWMIPLLWSSLMISYPSCYAQDTHRIDSLLATIADRQMQQTDFFYKGSFPSFRRYGRGDKLKPDNNIFFTGLIAFTLKYLQPYMSPRQQVQSDSIIQRAQAAYPHFRNTSGLPTYNFWRTHPPLVFPNSGFLNLFNKSQQLPDDLDDTAILWLSQNPSDSIIHLVKRLMAEHANGSLNLIRNTRPAYRDLPAYSTWFGVKMPIDFDFCVLCNVLYFVHYFNLPFNRQDSASVKLLHKMITDSSYLTRPAFISPHYGRTPILLYHISRLLAATSLPALDSLKPQLLQTARMQYRQSDNWLDSILLSTTIIRLGGDPLPVSLPGAHDLNAGDNTFFVASFSSILPRFWKKLLLFSQWIKYYFICPAYRQTLYLENQLLRVQVHGRENRLSVNDSFVWFLNLCTIL